MKRRMIRRRAAVVRAGAAACVATAARADTLTLNDGTVLSNCIVRDEGVQLTVWASMADVGTPKMQVVPRSRLKDLKLERGDDWDKHPELPDLTVTFIEFNPKLAGFHGVVQYDNLGRPWLGGSPKLVDMGDKKYTDPEGAAKNLKTKYQPGEELTLTAHIKNLGFKDAQPFKIEWLIDKQPAGSGAYDKPLKEMEEATFPLKWKWQDGFHEVTVKIVTDQPEIAKINNEATDALWAQPYTYTVSKGRIAACHQPRSAYGTFSFEDYYRWHLDIENLLLARSVFPSTPEGCKFRVRLDSIVYADKVVDNKALIGDKTFEAKRIDGIRYDDGGWAWNDSKEEIEKNEWKVPAKPGWIQTEWSLPHELGHQLGLVDWYADDYDGRDTQVWPDNGAKVTHFQVYANQMMHWHGPTIYGEADAAYLNYTIDKPRGHFGDYYFAIPKENFLYVVDINGKPLADAKIEIYQRGAEVDPQGKPGEEQGVKWFPLIEDGNFDRAMSKDPVIVGATGQDGLLRLPNRPVAEVKTFNGFQRQPNPFGNINVVGNRALMLARITKDGKQTYYMLEAWDFLVAWFRGQKDRFVLTLKTPYGSVDSPPPPADVKVELIDPDHAKVTWLPAKNPRDNYLDYAIGYRIYRKFSNDDLAERPWWVAATVGPEKREVVLDLRDRVGDIYWYGPHTLRFAVTTIGMNSIESGLAETLVPDKK